MTDARQARELGEALEFLAYGSLRDEPWLCGWCKSERVERDYRRDELVCLDCDRMTSMRVAAELREQRVRQRIDSGVGGPLVKAYENPASRGSG